MRRFLVLLVAAAACGDDAGGPVFLDNASDEAFAVMRAEIEGGHVTTDLAHAARLVEPASVSRARPATFRWADGAGKPHGIETGRFVWLELSGGVDVVALGSTSWTPDAATWGRITSGAEVTVRLYTATMDGGRLIDGPWQAAPVSLAVSP